MISVFLPYDNIFSISPSNILSPAFNPSGLNGRKDLAVVHDSFQLFPSHSLGVFFVLFCFILIGAALLQSEAL